MRPLACVPLVVGTLSGETEYRYGDLSDGLRFVAGQALGANLYKRNIIWQVPDVNCRVGVSSGTSGVS